MRARVVGMGVAGVVVGLAVPFLGLSTIPLAAAAAENCAAGLASDFNGDGYSDTVVADSSATVSGQAQAGRVIVLYGDNDNRIGEGALTTLYQGAASIGGVPEANDRFGFALAVADLDCDDYTDLVVGTPNEDINGQADSGYVQVIWGAATGLGTGDASLQVTQLTFGNSVVAGDQFGYAVDALEDVGQGGTGAPDAYALGIGAPGTNVGAADDAGWAGFLVAYDGGNVPVEVTQDTPAIPGAAEAGDRFGASLSVNYLTGDGDTVDAVISSPNEDVGALADAGSITVVTDIYYDELDGGVSFTQDSPGVPGAAEAGDVFGRSVDTVRVGGTTWLVAGAPGEDIGAAGNAGAAQLFTSDTTSVTPEPEGLSQDTAGVADTSEAGDLFGDRVALLAPGLGDAQIRLAVSSPYENGSATDSGLVQVFPVTDIDAEVGYAQDSPGVPGGVDAGDRFGASLAFVSGFAERALIVGVPDDVDNTLGMVNVIPLGGGVPRFWEPGIGGVPAGGSRFGDTLGGVGGGTT